MLTRTAVADSLALLVFVTIGVLTHDASLTAWIRDLLCFELAWFALWRLPLPLRWLLGVTIAVAVRAALVTSRSTSGASRLRSSPCSCCSAARCCGRRGSGVDRLQCGEKEREDDHVRPEERAEPDGRKRRRSDRCVHQGTVRHRIRRAHESVHRSTIDGSTPFHKHRSGNDLGGALLGDRV
jgi:hypothetical protein